MIARFRHFFVLLITLLVMFQIGASVLPEPKEHKSPILTTTAIIEIYEEDVFKGIVLIERGKAPFGKAIPGGKVEYGETVEAAVRREMMEEVNLELLDLIQFKVYSEPSRDFRHHSVEITHVAKSFKLPKAGDDAAKAFLVKLDEIPWNELAFDHAKVLSDYIDWKQNSKSSLINMPTHDIIEEYFKDFEVLSKKGKWEELFTKGIKALDVARRDTRVNDEARICAHLTSISFYQEDYDKALEYAKVCHDLSEEFTDPSLFIQSLYLESAINRALAGRDEGLQQNYYSKAVEIAERALSLYESKALDNNLLKGKIYFNLGAAHADNPRGNLDAAIECFSEALKSFENANDLESQMRTHIRLGKVYLLQKSFEYTQKAIDKARSLITSERILMHSDYLDAQLKVAMNNFLDAAEVAKKGLEKARSLGSKEDEMRFSMLLKDINKYLNN